MPKGIVGVVGSLLGLDVTRFVDQFNSALGLEEKVELILGNRSLLGVEDLSNEALRGSARYLLQFHCDACYTVKELGTDLRSLSNDLVLVPAGQRISTFLRATADQLSKGGRTFEEQDVLTSVLKTEYHPTVTLESFHRSYSSFSGLLEVSSFAYDLFGQVEDRMSDEDVEAAGEHNLGFLRKLLLVGSLDESREDWKNRRDRSMFYGAIGASESQAALLEGLLVSAPTQVRQLVGRLSLATFQQGVVRLVELLSQQLPVASPTTPVTFLTPEELTLTPPRGLEPLTQVWLRE